MSDAVKHPSHYRSESGHEAIDVISAWGLNFALGNVIKYVCRAGLKSRDTELEDLRKALFYLESEIKARQESSDSGSH
jgi:hypothetical protein